MIPIKDKNPTKTFPYVTIFLIALNFFVYITPIFSRDPTVTRLYTYYKHGMIPALFLFQGNQELYRENWNRLKGKALEPLSGYYRTRGEYIQELKRRKQMITVFKLLEEGDRKARFELGTLLASLFLHGGLLHLLGNMLFLWIFGNNIEDACGHIKFVIFYILGGVLASLTQMAISAGSIVPVIGASGAVSGILGAYLLLYPKAEVLTLIPIYPFMYPIELPAYVFLVYWIFVQFISGLPSLSRIGGGVAWFAHIGGFFVGIILIIFFKKRDIKFFRGEIQEPDATD